MLKKLFATIGKIILSAILSFAILTAFCFLYYNIPAHKNNDDGSTDYKWESNVFYSRATEGFAWGRTNNDGFVNSFDYTKGMPIDVLIMGSSQMEAFQVNMDESTSAKLNDLLGEKTVYNIGISGQSLLSCVQGLESALQKYSPRKFVILETSRLSFSPKDLDDVLNGTYTRIPPHTGTLVSLLQKNQYLRLLYAQVNNYSKRSSGDIDEDNNSSNDKTTLTDDNVILTGSMLKMIAKTVSSYNGVRAIICFHPNLSVNSENDLVIDRNDNSVEIFKKLCENNGVIFLDMSEKFKHEFSENHILPYGFPNTTIGKGHLNNNGHTMIAEELYKIIREVG